MRNCGGDFVEGMIREEDNMIYKEKEMESKALLEAAAQMCAAARTAPKAKGVDEIHTVVLTGEDKDILADKMDEIGLRDFGEGRDGWFRRDADNLRKAQAVVMIGTQRGYRGVQDCGFCGFGDCAGCKKAGGACVMVSVDLGIAIGSACAAAADLRVDNRIMFSIGKAAMEMDYGYGDVVWQGIPLSIAGKNVFFDR